MKKTFLTMVITAFILSSGFAQANSFYNLNEVVQKFKEIVEELHAQAEKALMELGPIMPVNFSKK